jgi:hypothetical protein
MVVVEMHREVLVVVAKPLGQPPLAVMVELGRRGE